ncbi:terpenoid synthase, partial [Fomitiporia mediterranea MF3/22]|uniref:terpenoid synthase n=1 Tax=Fomitiporia mediterranea (strain MF3/22) TaxID=694068 RepID=UPI0004408CFB
KLLGTYVYPYTDAEGLYIGTDFEMLLFTVDKFTNVQDTDSTKLTCDIFINVLKRVSGNDSSLVTLFTKDFIVHLSCIASPEICERFVSYCIEYIDATMKEADLCTTNKIPSFKEYTHLRQGNRGVFATFDVIEAVSSHITPLNTVLRITLPPDVFEDPNFQNICCSMNDLICLANDVYSYPMEYARGIDQINAVTAIKQEKGVSMQEAVEFVADHFKKHIETVNSCKRNIRSFGPEADNAICSYIHGMEQWLYGYIIWSFDTHRYFRQEYEKVKQTMTVKVMTRKYKSLE